ncbi:MAG: hypothetical protein PQJ61_03480 [Spirochaetales bacterium]|uniref:Uncharacterized protein n=1 Tax=Candidatus Thalassospirochaeta sargassi TaxID=3119039 RepID=A0AAJ1IE75_9SPIO|nr:hypothetical protein [Spirochaetales bacterium]
MNDTAILEKPEISTSVGMLIPTVTHEEDGRKKNDEIRYFSTGELRSVPLEGSAEIMTSAGTFPAELVTFYKSGNLKRIFPLNGRISAYWTEEDEYSLAETLEIQSPSGEVKTKPIYIQFYETGELQSVALWPGETIEIETPAGLINVRKGITFHKNGTIASCEPADEISVKTVIGDIFVYDPDPDGIKAESSTLAFTDEGEISCVSTVSNRVIVNKGMSSKAVYSPYIISSYCGGEYTVVPLKIDLENGKISCMNMSGTFKAGNTWSPVNIEMFSHNINLNKKLCSF